MNQPLYQTIFNDLQTAILTGELPVDSQLPTEKELSHTYKVSRITSKRALTELEQLGLIYRVRGKGSFVKSSAPEQMLPSPTKTRRILFLLPYVADLSVGDFTKGLNPVMQDKQMDVMMTTHDFLQNKTHTQSVRQRYLGYLEALDKAGLAFHTSLDDKSATFDELLSYITKYEVTAFVCENDVVAIQTMNFLRQHDYHGEALITWLETNERPSDSKFPVSFIKRQSTKEK